jgi:hypothetical protein
MPNVIGEREDGDKDLYKKRKWVCRKDKWAVKVEKQEIIKLVIMFYEDVSDLLCLLHLQSSPRKGYFNKASLL